MNRSVHVQLFAANFPYPIASVRSQSFVGKFFSRIRLQFLSRFLACHKQPDEVLERHTAVAEDWQEAVCCLSQWAPLTDVHQLHTDDKSFKARAFDLNIKLATEKAN